MKGIPCLYYGDEFGMEGRPEDGTDEHSGGDDAMRRPMLDCAKPATWPAIGQSRLALNKKLIAMRKRTTPCSAPRARWTSATCGSTRTLASSSSW